jgi:hypothetical protein
MVNEVTKDDKTVSTSTSAQWQAQSKAETNLNPPD